MLNSELISFLRAKIAESHGCLPSDVTPEFIERARNELYRNPSHRFINSNSHLRTPNMHEIDATHKIAMMFLNEILESSEDA